MVISFLFTCEASCHKLDKDREVKLESTHPPVNQLTTVVMLCSDKTQNNSLNLFESANRLKSSSTPLCTDKTLS